MRRKIVTARAQNVDAMGANSEPQNTPPITDVPIKRGRGRPRIHPLPVVDNTTIKRGRGRPRIHPLPTETPLIESVATEKEKPGSPVRLEITPDLYGPNGVPHVPIVPAGTNIHIRPQADIPKRRGRKPKAVTTQTGWGMFNMEASYLIDEFFKRKTDVIQKIEAEMKEPWSRIRGTNRKFCPVRITITIDENDLVKARK